MVLSEYSIIFPEGESMKGDYIESWHNTKCVTMFGMPMWNREF